MGRSDTYRNAFEISFVNPNSDNNTGNTNNNSNASAKTTDNATNNNNNAGTNTTGDAGGGWFNYGKYQMQRPDNKKVRNKVMDSYDTNAQAAARDTNTANQNVVFNAFDDNQMKRVDPDVYRDHAKDPVNGPLNGKSFANTLFASRAADAYNNRRHLKYGTTGSDTRSYGSIAATNLGTERYEPIDTQEMRQMRANENIDTKAREAQTARSEAVKNYKLELQRLLDNNKAAFAQLQDTTGVNMERMIQQAIHTAEYSQTYAQYLNNLNTMFTQYLNEDIRMRVASILSRSSYVFMYCYMNGLGIDGATKAKHNYLDNTINSIADPAERAFVGAAVNMELGAMDIYATTDMYKNAATTSLF